MSKDVMQLTLGGQNYKVTRAYLCAYIIDPERPMNTINGVPRSGLYWTLQVDMEEDFMSFWHGNIEFPNLHRWPDLVRYEFNWDNPKNLTTGELNGSWYHNGHLEILEASLRFMERDGCKFRLAWEGFCSDAPIDCEPEPEECLEFKIDCWCVFGGIGGYHLKREIIPRYLEVGDFLEEMTDSLDPVSGLSGFKPIC